MDTNKMPECWQDFADIIGAGVGKVLLYGLPGTGKTYAGLKQGQTEGGAFRLICSPEMTSADVEGAFMPSDNGFTYLEGAALKAWRGNGVVGGRLVVDEIDLASGDVLAKIQAFCDSDLSAEFHHPITGEIVKPLPGFSVVATSNCEDPDDLPPAIRDRFTVAIRIDAPHPLALEALPEALRGVAASIVGKASDDRAISLRGFHTFTQLRASGFTEDRAARLAFGINRAEALLDTIRVNGIA